MAVFPGLGSDNLPVDGGSQQARLVRLPNDRVGLLEVVFHFLGEVPDFKVMLPFQGIITQFEIRADGLPLVCMPFNIHEDSGRYHTICSRVTPDVGKVEW